MSKATSHQVRNLYLANPDTPQEVAYYAIILTTHYDDIERDYNTTWAVKISKSLFPGEGYEAHVWMQKWEYMATGKDPEELVLIAQYVLLADNEGFE